MAAASPTCIRYMVTLNRSRDDSSSPISSAMPFITLDLRSLLIPKNSLTRAVDKSERAFSRPSTRTQGTSPSAK